MRLLINIFILVAIAWGGWNYLSKNTDILDPFKGSGGSISQEKVQEAVKKLSTGISKNLSSLTEPISFPVDGNTLPGPLSKIETGTQTTHASISRSGIIAQTNTERTKQSLGVLAESSKLNGSAQIKAEDILTRQYFEHTAPDGTTSGDLALAVGYEYLLIGENLALGNFKDDLDVVTAWMNSPGHRANILKQEFQEIGVGVAKGLYDGHTVWVVVQHFGRPRASCPPLDSVLRIKIETGDVEIAKIVTTLENLKKQVEQGRAEGKDMNAEVEIYNQTLASYNAKFSELNNLRRTYNEQVRVFNSCLAGVQTTSGGH